MSSTCSQLLKAYNKKAVLKGIPPTPCSQVVPLLPNPELASHFVLLGIHFLTFRKGHVRQKASKLSKGLRVQCLKVF